MVELDGYSHNFKQEEDNLRDTKLKTSGCDTLRISEQDRI